MCIRDSFGSEINISGGTLDSFFEASDGSVVNISGGFVGDDFNALAGSQINILGSGFLLGGVELDTLLPGQAFTIFDRDVNLTGVLAGGGAFSLDLNSTFPEGSDFFDSEATVTVTIPVPEPSSLTLVSMVLAMGLARRRR